MTLSPRPVKLLFFAAWFLFLSSAGVSAKGIIPDFVELAEQLKPLVVNISTSKTIKSPIIHQRTPGPSGIDPFDDFFGRFFQETPQRPMKQRSLGSGFIISDDGYILTNNHVVSGADEIKVKLADGREFKAETKGTDEKLDLAILKIDGKDHFLVATLGDSDRIRVGEWVLAIGNPFGLEQTVTAGILSAKGRVIGSGPYDDYLQTDASINPGNSGGPLFNTNGEVVGINTAMVAGGQGIGFAIPINLAKNSITQLRETGKVARGWIGVSVQAITPDLAKSFGIEEEKGALVSEVAKDSPADKAGIQSGDIIQVFDGKTVHEMTELPKMVAVTPAGKEVMVKIIRNGRVMELSVAVSAMKDKENESAVKVPDKLGMSVRDLTPEIVGKMGTGEGGGVLVTEVKPGGLADEAGVAKGDIIKEINGARISSVDDYEKVITSRQKGPATRILLRRGNSSLFIAIKNN